MKKLLCVLLALVLLLSLGACSLERKTETQKEETEEKEEPDIEMNIDRYFLYVENGTLYRLDTVREKSEKIGLDISVHSISDAIVCDTRGAMVAKLYNEQTNISGVMYLGETSDEAVYFGDRTELVRISKDGKFVFYLKIDGDEKTLYRYDAAQDQSKMLVENVYSASVSEDGKRAFVVSPNGSETENATLYYVEGNKIQEIADDVNRRVNASQDCSVAAYLKMDEEDSKTAGNYAAYTWSKEEKEQKLPFTAYEIVIFDEKNIYYVQGNALSDGYEHHYYDGRESWLLTKKGSSHGHKAGNYLYAYIGQDGAESSFYAAYQGSAVKTNMMMCHVRGNIIFLSQDDKCIYGWGKDGMMYQLKLNGQGELKETALWETGTYSPRKMQFCGKTLRYWKDQALYCNDEKITEEYDDDILSTLGDVLIYKKDDTLFRYEDDQITEFTVDAHIDAFYPAKNDKVVSWRDGGSVTLLYEGSEEEKDVSFGSDVTDLVLVHTWTHAGLSNTTLAHERTGAWFQRECLPVVWQR